MEVDPEAEAEGASSPSSPLWGAPGHFKETLLFHHSLYILLWLSPTDNNITCLWCQCLSPWPKDAFVPAFPKEHGSWPEVLKYHFLWVSNAHIFMHMHYGSVVGRDSSSFWQTPLPFSLDLTLLCPRPAKGIVCWNLEFSPQEKYLMWTFLWP